MDSILSIEFLRQYVYHLPKKKYPVLLPLVVRNSWIIPRMNHNMEI